MTIEIFKKEEITDQLIIDMTNLISDEIGNDEDGRRLHNFDYYNWKLRLNPYGSYIVANYYEGQMMGVLSFTAKGNGSHNTGELLYELGDVYVSSKKKGLGYFFRMLRKFHKEFKGILVYGTPNDLALPSELKVGYRQYNLGIKYRFLPLGCPLFHYLYNSLEFAKYFFWIDFIIKYFFQKLNYIFVKSIESEQKIYIDELDFESFNHSLFYKSKEYVDWRYIRTPEAYKYMSANSGKNVLIYKIFSLKGIPFIMVVDHNLGSNNKLKRQLLKKILKNEHVFGFFEMSNNADCTTMPKYFSISVKTIKFITYGLNIDQDTLSSQISFVAGDGDNA